MINLTNIENESNRDLDNFIALYSLSNTYPLQKRLPQSTALEKISKENSISREKDYPAKRVVFNSLKDGTLDINACYEKIDWEKPQKELPKVGNMDYLLGKLEKFNEPYSFYEEFRSPNEQEEDSEPVYLLEKPKKSRPDTKYLDSLIEKRKIQRSYSLEKRRKPKTEALESSIKTAIISRPKEEIDWSPVEISACGYCAGERFLEDYKAEKPVSSEAVLEMLDESDSY